MKSFSDFIARWQTSGSPLLLLALLALPFLGAGQTGIGIVLLTNPTYQFAPTTVDSTSTFQLQLNNAVGVPQTVYFGGLAAPFALANSAPIVVPALGSTTIELQFSPESVGTFVDTLAVVGNIFGSANLVVSGEGIQVLLEWSSYAVEFEQTAVGTTSYADIAVTNVGDGVAVLNGLPGGEENVFNVEFIDDWETTGLTPCGTWNGINYYPFTLTIVPANNGYNGYFNGHIIAQVGAEHITGNPDGYVSYLTFELAAWHSGMLQVSAPYEGWNASFPVGSSFDVCLPVSDESGYSFTWQVYSDNCNFDGTQLTLTDHFGNIAWQTPDWSEFNNNYCDYGSDYAGSPNLVVTPPPFTAGELQEGETQIARFSFSPLNSGLSTGQVAISTNSPVEPLVTVACSGVAVSEVSGEVCNTVWTLANSPYTLVGNVTVPAGCTLTIEPGVVVNGDAGIIVEGELIAVGEPAAQVILDGPAIQSKSGSVMQLEYTSQQSSDLVILNNYETQLNDVYHEDFENYTSGNHPFTCFNRGCCASYHIGSMGNGWGCEVTSITENATNSHSGQKSFQWFSNTYYADLFLYQPIVANESGWYYLSFGIKTTQQERDHGFSAFYSKNGQTPCTSCFGTDSWILFYESAREDNTSLEDRIIGTYIYLNAGERVNLRIEHLMANDGWGCRNEQRSWIDDVRLTQVQGVEADYVVYQNNFNQNLGYDENNILNSLGWSGYNNNTFVNGNTFLEHPGNHLQFRCYYNEDWIRTQEFTAPVSGYYTIRYNEHIASRGQYSVPAMNARIGGGDWFNIYERTVRTCDSYFDHYNGWRWRTHTIGFVEAGQTFQIEFNPYISSPDLNWNIDDMSIQRLPMGLDGIQIESDVAWSLSNSEVNSIQAHSSPEGLTMSTIDELTISSVSGTITIEESSIGTCNITNPHITLEWVDVGSGGCALDALGGGATLFGCEFSNAMSNALEISNGTFELVNCIVTDAGENGIQTSENGILHLDYSTVAANGAAGLDLGGGFHQITNSIIYGNNSTSGYAQILGADANTYPGDEVAYVMASHSLIQGYGSFGTPDGQNINTTDWTWEESPNFFWGEGMLSSNPQFADEELHLQPWSPAVDAAMPWHTDAHMPYGLGGLRADMGAYGGPGNAGWGGQPAPSGAASLGGVVDSPQDQGGQVGLLFGASAFDEAWVPENVTHYTVWRHFDPSGTAIAEVADGNWEQVGTMNALGLNGYAFQAPTLGNTNTYGEFESCYFVAAHTADAGTYWVSNVMCGESEDNLAPEAPVVNGMVLGAGGVEIVWDAPVEADYAFTMVESDQGFSATVSGDTLVVDGTSVGGGVYTVRHVDVNGNTSAPVQWVAGAPAGADIIVLKAGWNLISTDRVPENSAPAAFFAGLASGNLQMVTGFNGGVQYYNPSGLSFLNTLPQLESGRGYWVRVAADDTLEVQGAALPAGYLPTLEAGWNLIGYTPQAASTPQAFFADEVAAGNLQYVTGFDGGAQFFDPNGLAFLNTLTALRNGYGYWVKLAAGSNGMAPGEEDETTPNFDVVNGRSAALAPFAGEHVEVVDAQGQVVARVPVLAGGYLMTTPVFGDDPATEAVEGVAAGSALRFRFRGMFADQTLSPTSSMSLHELSLSFDGLAGQQVALCQSANGATGATAVDGSAGAAGALGVFPNPTNGPVRWRAEVPQGAVAWQVTDVTGRRMAAMEGLSHDGGIWDAMWDASGLAPGVYTWTLWVDGAVFAQVRWMRS